MRSSTETVRPGAWLPILLGLGFASPAGAEAPAQRVGLEVGYSYWSAAGEIVPEAPSLDPGDFGRFDTEGWSVGVRYVFRVTERRSGSLWLGPSVGFFRHANTVRVLIEGDTFVTDGELRLRGLVVGGQAEWLWDGRGAWRPFAVAAVEYQQADSAAEAGGLVLEEYENSRAVGGSAGFGTEIRWGGQDAPLALRALVRVRWFDFGNVSWAESDSPPLSGPSYEVALGFTWRNR